MNTPGYEKLAAVLRAAYEQASAGKGRERHASDGVPFQDQPISAINRTLGSIDGLLYQASKKAMESRRLPAGRAQAELLGAINYLAAAVIALDTWAADTLPRADALDPTPKKPADNDIGATICCGDTAGCTRPCVPRLLAGADADGWIDWPGGECPVPDGTLVEVRLRNGDIHAGRALEDAATAPDMWNIGMPGDPRPRPHESDIIRFRIIPQPLKA